MFRIGFGYDVHQLAEGRTFKLGGIVIPHHKGPVGHSDADVLIHSICDALLGAANLRDIGFQFPDTSAEYKDTDSKVLLKRVIDLLLENNYSIANIDSTVCLQQPKIKDFIPSMQKVLAETMQIAIDQISIKATTTETLGFVGREEGVAAYAVALIFKNQ
jgi:2-C-methyl-D-erythritol 2,4-cyclodiphosphate synthase